MKNLTQIMLASILCALTSNAFAIAITPIAGEIIIRPTSDAQATPVNLDADADAEKVAFSCLSSSTDCTSNSEGVAFIATGDFAPLDDMFVDFSDFTFDPLPAGGATLWTANDAFSNVFTPDYDDNQHHHTRHG